MAAHSNPSPLTIDLTNPDLSVQSGHLKLGGANPHGVEINANSRYLTLAGRPWTPVMGEFHFSRYPAQDWRGAAQDEGRRYPYRLHLHLLDPP